MSKRHSRRGQPTRWQYSRANSKLNRLKRSGEVDSNIGIAKPSAPVIINSMNSHALRHGVTYEQAQNFIDSSRTMFNQGNRNLYVSRDGNVVVLVENNRAIAAYPKIKFDERMTKALEVLENERIL